MSRIRWDLAGKTTRRVGNDVWPIAGSKVMVLFLFRLEINLWFPWFPTLTSKPHPKELLNDHFHSATLRALFIRSLSLSKKVRSTTELLVTNNCVCAFDPLDNLGIVDEVSAALRSTSMGPQHCSLNCKVTDEEASLGLDPMPSPWRMLAGSRGRRRVALRVGRSRLIRGPRARPTSHRDGSLYTRAVGDSPASAREALSK